MIEIEEIIKEGYKYHHTGSARGYVSRKVDYIVKRPRFDTTMYYYKHYYIKEN